MGQKILRVGAQAPHLRRRIDRRGQPSDVNERRQSSDELSRHAGSRCHKDGEFHRRTGGVPRHREMGRVLDHELFARSSAGLPERVKVRDQRLRN